jgi:hypothetical protein
MEEPILQAVAVNQVFFFGGIFLNSASDEPSAKNISRI